MNKKVLNFENVARSADKSNSNPGTTTNAQHYMHLGKDVKPGSSKDEVNVFDPLKEKRLSQQHAQQFVNN